jgi:cell division protein FtsA
MPAKNFIVAIELGSTKIKGIAGQKKSDGRIDVLAVVTEDATQCIRKGVVYNIDKTVQCITNIIQRLRTQLKSGIKHVYIGVGGQSIHSDLNTITKELGDEMPVTQQLIVDMMDQNRYMEYPEQEILDVEVQEYRADNLLQTEPVGIQCQRLDGNFLNILQSKRHYQKLNTCFEIAGVKIAELYLAPFAWLMPCSHQLRSVAVVCSLTLVPTPLPLWCSIRISFVTLLLYLWVATISLRISALFRLRNQRLRN